jgi:hypothetical protein
MIQIMWKKANINTFELILKFSQKSFISFIMEFTKIRQNLQNFDIRSNENFFKIEIFSIAVLIFFFLNLSI